MLTMGQHRPLFVYFRSFQQQSCRKIVDFNGIQTPIYRVEGNQPDHLTTTTAKFLFINKIKKYAIKIVFELLKLIFPERYNCYNNLDFKFWPYWEHNPSFQFQMCTQLPPL